ncbi:MAG: hypothetical protein R3F59_12155 [Myxococcota bacterium]
MARKDPIAHLGRHEQVPPSLVREIAALGPQGVEQLVALVGDRERWTAQPGRWWARSRCSRSSAAGPTP